MTYFFMYVNKASSDISQIYMDMKANLLYNKHFAARPSTTPAPPLNHISNLSLSGQTPPTYTNPQKSAHKILECSQQEILQGKLRRFLQSPS